jgi:signal transduction histidine kinase
MAAGRPECDDLPMSAWIGVDRNRAWTGGLLALGLLSSSIPLFVPGWWFDVTSSGHAADFATRVALGGSGLVSVVAGLIARSRRPENPIGTWLLLSGLLGPLAFMVGGEAPILTLASGIAFVAASGLGVAVLLAFPEGRLQGRSSWAIVVTCLAVLLFRLEQIVLADPVTTIPGWREPNPFRLDPPQSVIDAFNICYGVVGLGFLLVFGYWLARRWMALRGPGRRSIEPVLLGGLVFVAASVVQAMVEIVAPDEAGLLGTVRFVHTLSFSTISAGFMAGLLRVRMARSAIADLVVELAETPTPAELRSALASALDDPSLEVALWSDEKAAYEDENGAPVPDIGAVAGNRAVTVLERDGSPLAAILHDPALLDDPGLVASVATAVRLTVENDRLGREVEAQLAEVRASRTRIVEATDAERRRLERDIHDGAQQRLVALSLALGRAQEQLEARSNPEDVRLAASLAAAADEARTALNELRELARGIHPAILTQAGLDAAVGSLVQRSAVPARLEGSVARRLPAPLEATAYFVVSESLANAAKHAGASEVRVNLALTDDHLEIGVRDDGRGGATVDSGRGLGGLRDRVEASGGTLDVTSQAGAGTTVQVWLPIPEDMR